MHIRNLVKILDFLIFVAHNGRANPKDCHLNKTCVRYAQGTSSGEFHP